MDVNKGTEYMGVQGTTTREEANEYSENSRPAASPIQSKTITVLKHKHSKPQINPRSNPNMKRHIIIAACALVATIGFILAYFIEFEQYISSVGIIQLVSEPLAEEQCQSVEAISQEYAIVFDTSLTPYCPTVTQLLIEQDEQIQVSKQLLANQSNLEKFQQSIDENINLFDSDNPSEVYYYNWFNAYTYSINSSISQMQAVQDNEVMLRNQQQRLRNDAAASLLEAEEMLANQDAVLRSISTNTNLLGPSGLGYDEFNLLRGNIPAGFTDVNLRTINEILASGIDFNNNEDVRNLIDQGVDINSPRENSINQLQNSTSQLRHQIYELRDTIRRYDADIASQTVSTVNEDLIIEQARLDIQVTINNRQLDNRYSLEQTELEIDHISLLIDQAMAEAQASAYAYAAQPQCDDTAINITDTSADTAHDIAGTSSLQVLLTISAIDAFNIAVGQEVYVCFSILPSSSYGTVSGSITNITAELIEGQHMPAFVVDVALYDNLITQYLEDILSSTDNVISKTRIITNTTTVYRRLISSFRGSQNGQ